MRFKLREIVSVQMGYSFRTRLESRCTGAVAVVQMKDLTDENRVDCSGMMRIDMEKPKEHQLVKPGDLIFRSRGLTANSAIMADDPGIAVVAAPLLRIRVTDCRVLPEYLNWFISQAPARIFLASHAKGTAQKMISKEALESLDVLVPSLERQRRVVEAAALAEKEQSIMKKLAEKRRQYISAALMQLAKGE